MLDPVVSLDATHLELTRSVVVSEKLFGDDDEFYEIAPADGGVRLHLAARVDGEHKHPLGATVTEGEAHESPQTAARVAEVPILPLLVSDSGRSCRLSVRLF